MTLVAELRHKKHRITVETGTFERVDKICRDWCNKVNKNAIVKHYDHGLKPAVVIVRYFHDGEKLTVENAISHQSDPA